MKKIFISPIPNGTLLFTPSRKFYLFVSGVAFILAMQNKINNSSYKSPNYQSLP